MALPRAHASTRRPLWRTAEARRGERSARRAPGRTLRHRLFVKPRQASPELDSPRATSHLRRKLSSDSVTSSSTSAGSPGSSAADSEEESVASSSPEVIARSAAIHPADGHIVESGLLVLPDLGDGSRLARGAAALLGQAVVKGEGGGAAPCFHAAHVPAITLQDYATRLVRLFRASPACMPLALLFLDRAARRCAGFGLDAQNCHMLLLTSLVVAAKVHDDDFYANTFYATVGGIQVRELNKMELELLKILGFVLHVQPEEFAAYARLCHAAAPEQL